MKEEKIISIEDRIPRLKKQRRQKANRRLIFYLSLFFLLISFIIYLQSPLSYIKNIKIKGNHILTDAEIVELTGLDEKSNIWKVKLSELTSTISKNPYVKEIEIHRKLPSSLLIDLEEYQVIGYIARDDNFLTLLDNGEEVISKESFLKGDAPLLIDFTDDEMISLLSKQLKELPLNILRLISEVHWNPEAENKHKIDLFMNDGFLVKASIRNLSEKMVAYPSIVSQLDPEEKGIIHLNVGAYFESFSK